MRAMESNVNHVEPGRCCREPGNPVRSRRVGTAAGADEGDEFFLSLQFSTFFLQLLAFFPTLLTFFPFSMFRV